MNSTANGSSGSWSCLNFSALKIGGTVTYCLITIVSLVANSLIVIIVSKTPNLKKNYKLFIANMASSDLLYPIFSIPFKLSLLHANSFLIGGQLGQALCKLLPFFGNVSFVVSIQNPILIAVDRLEPWCCHSVRHSSDPSCVPSSFLPRVCLHECHSFYFARLVGLRTSWIPGGSQLCTMEESIRWILVLCQCRTSSHHSVYLHPCAAVSHPLLHHLYQAQDTGTPRWTVDQQSATAEKKKQ